MFMNRNFSSNTTATTQMSSSNTQFENDSNSNYTSSNVFS